ncbi:hypothetical protein WQQ_15230 [Hydrocarboniphaga effusa AP103]|uniref:Uncharacterized protein n=1 Tax=Hydrocarboniphaga effusa AP103 TaxID=1172194 RepID=I8I508_9GAMM|nr:hypothetical protein WQQ_15230 [Hydrocarboniphaga effusa AP103]
MKPQITPRSSNSASRSSRASKELRHEAADHAGIRCFVVDGLMLQRSCGMKPQIT